MALDLDQFKQTFFEESAEGLDIMEDGLLNLQPGSPDIDLVNDIFRAAHSMKGAAGNFGFNHVVDFTHALETLLDEMRAGSRNVTEDTVSLLLQSVDCLREMLSVLQEGTDPDESRSVELLQQIHALLENSGDTPATEAVAAEVPAAEVTGWKILFVPNPDLLRTGNDPARLFRVLKDLGTLTVQVSTEQLPSLDQLVPEDCYLSWSLTLLGNVAEEQIREVFEWVEDDCEIEISPLESAAPVQSEVSEQPQRSGTDRRTGGDRRESGGSKEATSIRVGTDKIDSLVNMVGELVITQSMLSQVGRGFDMDRLDALQNGLVQLERNSRELQDAVMRIRMLPINMVFSRFPRLVRDMSQTLGKDIELVVSGEQTELDKTVLEKIGDPLVHLVRNSLDHGIEAPDDRIESGKPPRGTIRLQAAHEGGKIVIQISDDGAGLPVNKILAKARERGLVEPDQTLSKEEVLDLIFQPGFSTADVVTDVSGRGVGMDVVRRNIKALSGMIDVESEEGVGTTFTIRLPLTVAIMDGQLVRVGTETYVLPLVSIVESIQIENQRLNVIASSQQVYTLRNEYIPIVRLHDLFGQKPDSNDLDKQLLVVVEGEGKKAGLVVDELLAQQQVVIKSLETNYMAIEGLSGATILGDGTVAVILDVTGIVHLSSSDLGAPTDLQPTDPQPTDLDHAA